MSQAYVIPCYNEAQRLPVAQLEQLLAGDPDLHVLLVDDGSSDGTKELLHSLSARLSRVEALILPQNGGKAEAVRAGLNHLLDKGHEWIGYADADFATPAPELLRLVSEAKRVRPEVLMGSRVLLLGTIIERKALRHYLGRVFATFASLTLGFPVYDTQCGAKLFCVSPVLKAVLAQPFLSRWAFDVELLGRFTKQFPNRTRYTFIEVPLQEWRDIGGSKLKATSMLKAGLDLIAIAYRLRRPL